MNSEMVSNKPRGKPKSGRTWKSVREHRHSDMIKVKPLRTSWEQKMEMKNLRKSVKALENELKELRKQEIEVNKKKLEAKQKRKEENERKGEIVQQIKNTGKIKKMKRKQLRMIEKR